MRIGTLLWDGTFPLKVSVFLGDMDPLYMVPWTHTSQPPKRHLDRLSRFLHNSTVCPTHKHTDHATYDICSRIVRIYALRACEAA